MRRPDGEDRVCLEAVAGSERWRVTVGPPANILQLVPACTPIAFAALPDSQAALVEVLESDEQGTALVTWLVQWSRHPHYVARRAPAPTRPRPCWWHLERDVVWWIDAAGGLWQVPLDGTSARACVEVGPQRRHADVMRVVVSTTESRPAADSLAARLAAAGDAAAVAGVGGRFEVQAGIYAQRGPAQARAAALRQRGFTGVRIESGDVTAVAPGLDFGHATGGSGRVAWVRQVERSGGVFSELWLQVPGESPRLLIPSLEGGLPPAP
jgi:hypothetical protein